MKLVGIEESSSSYGRRIYIFMQLYNFLIRKRFFILREKSWFFTEKSISIESTRYNRIKA